MLLTLLLFISICLLVDSITIFVNFLNDMILSQFHKCNLLPTIFHLWWNGRTTSNTDSVPQTSP